MKALILAAGKGSRLKIGYPKALFGVNGKTLLSHSMDYAVDAGVDEIIIVVNEELSKILFNTWSQYIYRGEMYHKYFNIPITYVLQNEPKGVVHAIECASEALDGDNFLLLHSDEIIQESRHKEMVEEFKRHPYTGLVGCVWDKAENISKSYSVITDNNNEYVIRCVEKPKHPQSDYPKGTGSVIFRYNIFDYIDKVPISYRGEKEMPDLIQVAVDNADDYKVFMIGDKHINVNTKEDLNIGNDGDDKHD